MPQTSFLKGPLDGNVPSSISMIWNPPKLSIILNLLKCNVFILKYEIIIVLIEVKWINCINSYLELELMANFWGRFCPSL